MTGGAKTVSISQSLLKEIAAHGEQTFPEECCGVLFGTYHNGRRSVEKLMAFPNLQDANRERRYLITPEHYLEAERIARAEKVDLLGFYHSHPNHPAHPSEFDREHAFPWFVYVIVSVMDGMSDGLTAWELSEDRTRFFEIKIQNDNVQT